METFLLKVVFKHGNSGKQILGQEKAVAAAASAIAYATAATAKAD